MLDKLVCPDNRHFPLELVVEAEEQDNGIGAGLICEQWCARNNLEIKPDSEPDRNLCHECMSIEIETAQLKCPQCGDVFPVEQGIPRLLHDMRGTRGAEDKQSEMQARDSQAKKYDSLALLKLLSRLEIPVALDMLDSDRAELIIELGAGTGRLTSRVAEQAKIVIAVDFSIESLLLSKSKSKAKNVAWVQADINRLPFREATADRILSCQVFEHLPGASARNMAVDEASRVLKPSGTFVISVYRDSWFWRLWGPKEGYHSGGIYYYRLNSREFEDMLGRQFAIRRNVSNLGLYLQIAKCVKKAF